MDRSLCAPTAICFSLCLTLLPVVRADDLRSQAPPQIIAESDPTTSKPATPIAPRPQTQNPDADAPAVATEASAPRREEYQGTNVQLLQLRSVSQISLASASRLKTEDGSMLRVPENTAKDHFAAAGQVGDVSFAGRSLHPNRNLYPICYRPLYFEDPNMERCGLGFGVLTDAVSAVRFFGRVPFVPYMMGANPPCTCVRALPDCPVCQKFGCDAYIPDPSLKAVGFQEFATIGLIFLIP